MKSERGDYIIGQIESGDTDDNLAHELLSEYFGGYSVKTLQRLLVSQHESSVKIGVWIASELGSDAKPVLIYFKQLICHTARYVRFFAIDVVMNCAGKNDTELLSGTVKLMRDTDDAVRWKAMRFLANAPIENLRSAFKEMDDLELARLTRWIIIDVCERKNYASIGERLESQSDIERLFGASAAARIKDVDASFLVAASSSSDEEIRSFSEELLRPC